MSYQFSTTTSLSDETYLESFVESISASLPNELRRNLEHLRDLDNASFKLMEDWREQQDECLKGVEETLLKVFRGEAVAAAAANEAKDDGGDDSSEARVGAGSKAPARGSKRKLAEKSPEKKVDCVQCRSRKAKCDGKQEYCLFGFDSDDNDTCDDNENADEQKHIKDQDYRKDCEKFGVQNHGQGGSTSSPLSQNQLNEFFQKRGPPTNEEIRNALRTQNPLYTSQCKEISNMHHELQQLSNEKRDTANQIKSLVDMALGRLGRDLERFEKELGIDNNMGATANGANTTGGGMSSTARGGLGGVLHHSHVASGGVMMGAGVHAVGNNSGAVSIAPSASSAPKAGSVNNLSSLRCSSSTATPIMLPPTNSSMQQQPYPSMRGIVPPPPKSVQTSNLAAIQVTPNSPDWILAKILSHDKTTKTYTLSDEDVQSNQIYKIPEKQVVVLRGMERNKWNRGDAVYAVYPDTTSFYHATVSTPPLNGFVMVQFKDDWDANGITHEKAVLMAHVMKVPPGMKS